MRGNTISVARIDPVTYPGAYTCTSDPDVNTNDELVESNNVASFALTGPLKLAVEETNNEPVIVWLPMNIFDPVIAYPNALICAELLTSPAGRVADVPLLPEVPADPLLPLVPLLPELPLVPDVPDEPEVPDDPDVPLVPLLPFCPEVPLVPDVPLPPPPPFNA